MVREKSDHKVICSSIAMLQERFRQLERMKEMREERELLKLISVSSNNQQHHSHHQWINSNFYDPSKLFFHSEIIFPTQPLDSQLLSLSLWPTSQLKKKHANNYWDWDIEIENAQNITSSKPSWLADVPLAQPSSMKKSEESSANSDVDTTLHL